MSLNMVVSDQRAEAIVLGSIIADESGGGLADIAIRDLTEEMFTTASAKRIFNSIVKVRESGSTVDGTTINYLCTNNEDMDYLGSLLHTVASTDKIDSYVEKMQHYYSLRLIERDIYKLAQSNDQEIGERLSDFISNVTTHNVESEGSKDYRVEALFPKFWSDFQQRMETKEEIIGLKSGIESLDKASGGFRGGDLIIVGALPSMGKTSFVISVIAKMIVDGTSPALFTYEMSDVQTMSNVISAVSLFDAGIQQVSRRYIERPSHHSPGNLEAIKQASEKVKASKAYFADRSISHRTIQSIRATAFKLKNEGRLDALFVDHVGLMVESFENERAELANLSGGLKRLAGELDIPIFLLSQLNVRGKEDIKRPVMGMLKGSSTLEADADTILFPWRPYAITKEGSPSDGTLYIGKSRSFASNDIPLYFDTESVCFQEGEEVDTYAEPSEGGF